MRTPAERKKNKPHLRFCFECGRKLRANFHVTRVLKEDGRARVLHVRCFQENRERYRTNDEAIGHKNAIAVLSLPKF